MREHLSPRTCALALVVALTLPMRSPRADPVPPPSPEWLAAVQAYVADPNGNRRALRELAAGRRDDLPPVVALLLADGYLRQGNRRAAAALFEDVLAHGPPEQLAGWAEIGLGWTALGDGDTTAAGARFARLSSGLPATRALARFMGALIAATDGDQAAAARGFDDLSSDSSAPFTLRQAAALGAAYADYWAGWYDASLERFRRAALGLGNSTLLDDARFGAAMALDALGDHERARAELTTLAAMESGRTIRGRASLLVSPDRRTFLRAAASRYRRLPIRAPEDQVLAMIDQDGPALARAALRRPMPAAAVERAGLAERSEPIRRSVPDTPATPPAGRVPRSATATSGPRTGTSLQLILVGLVAVALLVGARRRRTS